MKISKIRKGLVLFTMTAGALAVGCELIVDFDRTLIQEEAPEASIPDVGIPESFVPVAEAGAEDAQAGPADHDAGDAGEEADAADAADQ